MGKAMRDMVERIGPGDPLHRAFAAADHRIEQTVLKAKRLAERRTLGTKPAEIRRMRRITRDRRTAASIRRRQHAAADPTVRARGASGADLTFANMLTAAW